MEIGDKSPDVIVMTLEDGEVVMVWSVCMCMCVIVLGKKRKEEKTECCGREQLIKNG